MVDYLKDQLQSSRQQLLRLALQAEPNALRAEILGLEKGPVPPTLRSWCECLLTEIFPEPGGPVELEELLLEALDHQDPLRRTAALETLRALIAKEPRWSQAGPGRPIELARELADDPDERVRAAAQAINSSTAKTVEGLNRGDTLSPERNLSTPP